MNSRPIDFARLVHQRRMVRNFRPDDVPDEKILRILDLARRGPSAGYTQGQDFIVVRSPETKQKIAENCGEAFYVAKGFHPFISTAPILVVACTNEEAYHRRYREPDKASTDGTEMDWPVPYWFMDAGCAVMILLLAVVAEGLAAGFTGSQDLPALRRILGSA